MKIQQENNSSNPAELADPAVRLKEISEPNSGDKIRSSNPNMKN